MSFNKIDFMQPTFSKVFRGYDTTEVDIFLQDIFDVQSRMNDERNRLISRITQLESRLQEFNSRESSLHEALSASQRMSDEMQRIAQKEAQIIIDAAKSKSDNLIAEGLLKLKKLNEDIAKMEELKIEYTKTLRAMLESGFKELLRYEEEVKEQLNK